MEQSKQQIEAIDKFGVTPLQELPLPVELDGHSQEELKQLQRKLVRHLDFYLMPAVVILFLMNILDRESFDKQKQHRQCQD